MIPWMHVHGKLDPVIFSLGPLQVRWYGFMYVVGFVIGGILLKKLSKNGFFQVPTEKTDSLVTHLIIGMFIGARVFYVFIYNWDYFVNHLGEALAIWKGGLSFHGALVGLMIGAYIFSRKNKIHWMQTFDCMGLAGAQGLFWGRVGNFINGELYGRVVENKNYIFGMIFPGGGSQPRHPSQLYEGVFEGLVLSLIIWLAFPRLKRYGIVTPIFLIGYAIFRFFIEYFREPDAQLGYYFGGTTTMGQILCFIMALVGLGYYFYGKKLNLPVERKTKV